MTLTTFVVSTAWAADAPPPPLVEASPPQVRTPRSDVIPPPPATTAIAEGGGPEHGVGGVFAPAIMPRGSMAVYVMLGAPDVGGGYRQGFESVELEVRLWLNYLQASALLEVGGEKLGLRQGHLRVLPKPAGGHRAHPRPRVISQGEPR